MDLVPQPDSLKLVRQTWALKLVKEDVRRTGPGPRVNMDHDREPVAYDPAMTHWVKWYMLPRVLGKLWVKWTWSAVDLSQLWVKWYLLPGGSGPTLGQVDLVRSGSGPRRRGPMVWARWLDGLGWDIFRFRIFF